MDHDDLFCVKRNVNDPLFVVSIRGLSGLKLSSSLYSKFEIPSTDTTTHIVRSSIVTKAWLYQAI